MRNSPLIGKLTHRIIKAGDILNKRIGIIGLIVSLIVQGFSASDSLTHEIAMVSLFVFLMIYNFEHAKDFSKKSLIALGAIFIILMLGIYQLLSLIGDYLIAST